MTINDIFISKIQPNKHFRTDTSYDGGLTLNQVTMDGNTAYEATGGAIYKNKGSLSISETELNNNTAQYGGGIYFTLHENEHLHINDSAITNNVAEHASNNSTAGAIYVDGVLTEGSPVGEVLISGTTFSHNISRDLDLSSNNSNHTGGLYLVEIATPKIINSTFSHNTATDQAGGLRAYHSGTLELRNSTIAFNESLTNDGGGLSLAGTAVEAHNTIIAENKAFYDNDNMTGLLAEASGYNLLGPDEIGHPGTGNIVLGVGENAGLAPLGDYGGITLPSGNVVQTHALLSGSLAINNGSDARALGPDGSSLTTDQRGFERLVNFQDGPLPDIVDIGAYELQPKVTKADFNGDGREDFVTLEPVSSSLNVILGGNRTAGSGRWAELGPGVWTDFQPGDFNGDGRDDLMIRDGNTNTWSLALSESTGFVVYPTGETSNWARNDIYVGDFDGDGADEIIGRNNMASNWQLLDFDERSGVTQQSDFGSSLTDPQFQSAIYVGDVNRDGREDLVGKRSGTGWNVSVVVPHGNDSFSLASADNWGTWFDEYWQDGVLDTDGPYQEVIDIFANVYNHVEIEFYPGLMKGIEATRNTQAGNPWDQAALLVADLEAAGFKADIASGRVQASVAELIAWLGVDETSFGYENSLAVFILIYESFGGNPIPIDANGHNVLDPDNPQNDFINILSYATAIEFEHAWVRAEVPTATGLKYVDLDPAWKFKERQSGIDVDLDSANGMFDELAYVGLDSAEDRRLPSELFEDQVRQWLVANHPGKSLADVAHVGSIATMVFDAIPAGLSTEVMIIDRGLPGPTDDFTTYDNAQWIYDDATLRTGLTHRFDLTLEGKGETLFEVIKIDDLVVPEIVYSENGPGTIVLQWSRHDDGGTPDPLDDEWDAQIEINGNVTSASTYILGSQSAVITLEHFSPTFLIEAPSNPTDTRATIDDETVTFDGQPGRLVAVSLDANQHARESLSNLQKQAIHDSSTLIPLVRGGVDTEAQRTAGMVSLLTYTGAKYWYDLNEDDETIARLTGALTFQNKVGSGVTFAQPELLYFDINNTPLNANDDVQFIEHLTYGFAPRGLSVDLPNVTGKFLNRTTGFPHTEAFQLAGFNSSALEHNTIEEVINAESVSTMKGLQNAFQGNLGLDAEHNPIADDAILVFERTGSGAVYFRGELDTENSDPPAGTTPTSLSDLEARLVNHVPRGGGANNIAKTLWGYLSNSTESGVVGAVKILIPRGKSQVGNWVGSVYVAKLPGSTHYSIAQEGGTTTNGGYSGDNARALSEFHQPADFKFASYAGDPVNTANGSMFRDDMDFVFPNLGVPLSFARHYNSQNQDDLGLGVGWTHSFGDVLVSDTENPLDLVWITGTGQRHTFEKNGSSYSVPAALHGQFSQTPTTYVFKEKTGMEYHFEKTAAFNQNGLEIKGRLLRQLDNVGNGIYVTYDFSDPAQGSLRQIKHVRDIHTLNVNQTSRRVEFDYSTSGVIQQVRKIVDGSRAGGWNFNYDTTANSRPSLETVEYPSETGAPALQLTYNYYQSQ